MSIDDYLQDSMWQQPNNNSLLNHPGLQMIGPLKNDTLPYAMSHEQIEKLKELFAVPQKQPKTMSDIFDTLNWE
jgi:hypothetical protein